MDEPTISDVLAAMRTGFAQMDSKIDARFADLNAKVEAARSDVRSLRRSLSSEVAEVQESLNTLGAVLSVKIEGYADGTAEIGRRL